MFNFSANHLLLLSRMEYRTCVVFLMQDHSTRHSQHRSTLITTNTAFSDWGNILHNTTIATAIADRLVENSEIFLLGGESLRKTNKSQPSGE